MSRVSLVVIASRGSTEAQSVELRHQTDSETLREFLLAVPETRHSTGLENLSTKGVHEHRVSLVVIASLGQPNNNDSDLLSKVFFGDDPR